MTDRAQYIAGLRALADALATHPDLELPYTGRSGAIVIIPWREHQREQLAAWARVLPGRRDKAPRDDYFDLEGTFHGLKVKVICNRDEVCERIVTGTREVVEEVPDPEALAAVPTVTVTKTVEDVEWRCTPLLGDKLATGDGWRDEATGLMSGGYPPVLAANDAEAARTSWFDELWSKPSRGVQ